MTRRPPLGWLVGLAFVWALLWFLSIPGVLFAGRDLSAADPTPDLFVWWRHTFVFSYDECRGGYFDGLPLAAAIGGVFLVGAVAVGVVRPAHRRAVLVSYALVYLVALVVLALFVAPVIWGSATCYSG